MKQSKDIDKIIKPRRVDKPPGYLFSFKILDTEGSKVSKQILEELKIMSESKKGIKGKHIAKGTSNKEYEALYDYVRKEGLDKGGFEIERIYEVVIENTPHRIFFTPIYGKIKDKEDNQENDEESIIFSVIQMTTKHKKYSRGKNKKKKPRNPQVHNPPHISQSSPK